MSLLFHFTMMHEEVCEEYVFKFDIRILSNAYLLRHRIKTENPHQKMFLDGESGHESGRDFQPSLLRLSIKCLVNNTEEELCLN